MARGLAADLGQQGYTIVSGLARGIDTSAHIAALETGTIAVLAGGVNVIYPAENTDLAKSIEKSGLRISEQPMGVTPQARNGRFQPRRPISRTLRSICGTVATLGKAVREIIQPTELLLPMT